MNRLCSDRIKILFWFLFTMLHIYFVKLTEIFLSISPWLNRYHISMKVIIYKRMIVLQICSNLIKMLFWFVFTMVSNCFLTTTKLFFNISPWLNQYYIFKKSYYLQKSDCPLNMLRSYQNGFLQDVSNPFTLLHLQKGQQLTLFTLQVHEHLAHFSQLHAPIKSLGYFFKLVCGTKIFSFTSNPNSQGSKWTTNSSKQWCWRWT